MSSFRQPERRSFGATKTSAPFFRLPIHTNPHYKPPMARRRLSDKKRRTSEQPKWQPAVAAP
ncbi:hypothetical protein GCWU000324_02141 [Kingella oralis ATCC 51147]|uniref:Uncharacterized protein n=1 Tax=Kingella oralis ATCC 51147 TaxID=629741 RepID=C4GJB8_9NEIS|nr:hypothetical protein GCWU000324_02141 [Kingella oralis ATCC 51147]